MCQTHILWSYEITLSEISLANRNRLGQNFRWRRWLGWHAPLQTFGALRQTCTKWLFQTVWSPKQCVISCISRRPISLKFEHQMRICVVMNSFRTELRNFSDLLPQNFIFRVFFGARSPALAFSSGVNLNIASCSRRAKGLTHPLTFLCYLLFLRYRNAKLPLISGTLRQFAIFRLPI